MSVLQPQVNERGKPKLIIHHPCSNCLESSVVECDRADFLSREDDEDSEFVCGYYSGFG